MGGKRKKINLALVLCAAIVLNCMAWFGAGTKPEAAKAAETQELTLPEGGLEQLNTYEITEEEAAKVPSYDNGIYLYDNSIFSRGTGNYGYNQLSSKQKTFYDSLENSLRNFNNDDNGTYAEITISGKANYSPFRANFFNAGIQKEEASQAWVAFLADHPWLFWLGSYASGSDGSFIPLVKEEYENNVALQKSLDTTIQNAAGSYVNAVTGVSDTYEKVRIIHDRIVDHVNYAYKSDGKTPEDANWAHSVLGVLDGSHNTVVCEGYAKAFSFILNILGIPNVYIVGDSDGTGHAWNAVSFDDGSTYYYVDVTWDDQGGKGSTIENTYIYFAMPKDKFEPDHTADTTSGIGFNWQYALPTLGNDMDKTYFKKYAAYATDDMVSDTASATDFVNKAKEMAPGANCLMLLGENALQSVAMALGVTSYSYVPVKEYGMRLYTTPSGKTPTPEPTMSATPTPAPGTEPSSGPDTSPTPAPTSSSSPAVPSGAHIFSDYNYNKPVADNEAVIYGNGAARTVDGKKVNNKIFTAYTDISASYKYTVNSKGVVKALTGKVIAGITKSATKPEVNSKNKITDTSASKIARAKIKNGQITVTALGKESGLVYLWVIDTGSKGISACCPINVKMAPKQLKVQDTSGTALSKPKLENGKSLNIRIAGIVSGTTETNDCTYTSEVNTALQSYIQVSPIGSSGNQFTIQATGLKNNKNTNVFITFKCNQNNKKIKFALTITK